LVTPFGAAEVGGFTCRVTGLHGPKQGRRHGTLVAEDNGGKSMRTTEWEWQASILSEILKP
jgi:hypothetical protein